MAKPPRPSALLWGAFLALGGMALFLRLRAPGHRALAWIMAALLGLLALRVIALIRNWRQGRIPGARILLPALILVEGLGLIMTRASDLTLKLRLGTALALEVLLLVLAVRAWRKARNIPGDFLLMKVLFSGLAPWLRWALHGSTVYAVLWLFGFYATLKARPHQLRDGRLELHLGLMKSVSFPVNDLLSASPLPEFDDDWARHAYMKDLQTLVAKGNTILELKLSEPVRVLGLLGPGRPTQRLAVSVDDPSAFLAALGLPPA